MVHEERPGAQPQSSGVSIILASGSPRRHELLGKLVSRFGIITSSVEERGSDRAPYWYIEPLSLPDLYQIPAKADPRLWAWRKAVDVIEAHPQLDKSHIVIGADTVVAGPGKLLGKPGSEDEAVEMLEMLAGRRHYVVTGYALLRPDHPHAPITLSAGAVISTVVMRDYNGYEAAQYVSTGESLDKAGAYALQGEGSKLVERTRGCRNNIIGLPLCMLRRSLVASGGEVMPYPAGGYCNYCQTIEASSA